MVDRKDTKGVIRRSKKKKDRKDSKGVIRRCM
jgi:hypothetical protein